MIRIPALILGCLFWATTVFGAQPFVIQDIRVEGLQRISEGTIYNYLPLDRGDTLTASAGRTAIRELYNTGFFQDISMSHEGDILVITVLERPAIAAVTLSGNKAIKEEELRRVLNDIGLSEGEVFDRLVLEHLAGFEFVQVTTVLWLAGPLQFDRYAGRQFRLFTESK